MGEAGCDLQCASHDTAMDNNNETMDHSLNKELLECAGTGSLAEVTALLDKGAEANFDDNPPGVWGSQNRRSPIHEAIRRRDDERKAVLRVLLDHRADPNAVRSNYDWRGCGSSNTAFEMVLPDALKDRELLEMFLAAGADPNKVSRQDRHSMRTDATSVRSPLHMVAAAGNADCAEVLLEAKADVACMQTERMQNERGSAQDSSYSALHLAVQAGSVTTATLLLSHKADIDCISKHLDNVLSQKVHSPTDDPRNGNFVSNIKLVPVKETALHIAIQAGSAELIKMLRLWGADSTIPRKYGDESTSCAALISEERADLLEALECPWDETIHKICPKQVQEGVHAMLVSAHSGGTPGSDSDVMQLIFRQMAEANATESAE